VQDKARHFRTNAPQRLFQRYLKLNNFHITNGINEINIKWADRMIKIPIGKETYEDYTWKSTAMYYINKLADLLDDARRVREAIYKGFTDAYR
jgi:hypothetical protein